MTTHAENNCISLGVIEPSVEKVLIVVEATGNVCAVQLRANIGYSGSCAVQWRANISKLEVVQCNGELTLVQWRTNISAVAVEIAQYIGGLTSVHLRLFSAVEG